MKWLGKVGEKFGEHKTFRGSAAKKKKGRRRIHCAFNVEESRGKETENRIRTKLE